MRTVALRTETDARRSACPVQDVLNDIFKRLQRDRSGEVASYIPELRKANPEWFAACLVTADGKIYEVGETHQTFTIQSISKPFVYGMAIEDNGSPKFSRKSGWSPPAMHSKLSACGQAKAGQPDD
jgi:glutaminase